MSRANIKALVFDLGEVLIKLNFSKVMELRGSSERRLEASIHSMNQWPIYDAFERGVLKEADFLKHLNAELGISINIETFKTLWNSILGETVPGVEKILNRLATRYPLWTLTNSNESHIDYFKTHYPWHKEFQAVLTSFELGCRKPEKEIYQKLIGIVGVKAQEILFVDDRLENVEGARALGIQAELCSHTPRDLPKILGQYSIQY